MNTMLNSVRYNYQWAVRNSADKLIIRKAKRTTKELKSLGVKSVVDLGCGAGVLVDTLSRQAIFAMGIDKSEAVIQYANRHKMGSFINKEIGPNELCYHFDAVTACQVIEHLKHPELLFKMATSFLNKDGYLIIETPNWDNRDRWWSDWNGGIGKDHIIVYNAGKLNHLLEKYNYKLLSVRTKTFTFCLLNGITGRFLRFGKNKGSPGETPNSPSRSRRILRRLYYWLAFSWVGNLLLYIPCKITERNQRGFYLMVTACKRDV